MNTLRIERRTGVSFPRHVTPGCQAGLAAEAEQVERTRKPGHGPDLRYLCPTGSALILDQARALYRYWPDVLQAGLSL